MKQPFNCRHNPMCINSIDVFANINGRITPFSRDVYFVRAIGQDNSLLENIYNIDKFLSEKNNEFKKYIRINELNLISNQNDALYYSLTYDNWKNNKKLELKNIKITDNFSNILDYALKNILEKYILTKTVSSDSIVKNFGVKILFWLDCQMNQVFDNWNENIHIKVIADNVIKEQEYLFYLFLTFLGADVLLIQNRKDIDTKPDLLKYSSKLIIGEFGSEIIPEFSMDKYLQNSNLNSENNNIKITTSINQNSVLNIPKDIVNNITNEESSFSVNTEKSSQKVQISRQNHSQTTYKTQTNQLKEKEKEKSFEEIAKLASSVVMIGVFDEKDQFICSGSGIMIGEKGYILTNDHVVYKGTYFKVKIEDDDNEYVSYKIIKYNYELDLAIIKIERKLNPLPIFNEKDSQLVRGQKVVAIGSPLGLFNTVSDGIISGFRNIEGVETIQFTAPVSHGSSGGAVLNIYGQVIGIVSSGYSEGQNINLAVSYKNILGFAKGFY